MEQSVCDELSRQRKRSLNSIYDFNETTLLNLNSSINKKVKANSKLIISTQYDNLNATSSNLKNDSLHNLNNNLNNNNLIINDNNNNLNNSANSSLNRSKENRVHSNKSFNIEDIQKTAFNSTYDNHLNQLNQFSQFSQFTTNNQFFSTHSFNTEQSKMLNGMMLANNLINHTNQINGDVAATSQFSPNTLTGNSMNSSNNTISGLSPSSSYDSFSPRCKEEMSPSSMDCSLDQKKKKGPMPRQQEELCLVCGDRASGYHYNALTCEGCKGFFRRSITKNAVYSCKYGKNCEIDMYMRRKCQECRLKKCLTCGMRPECVVPEYQCAIKRENKRQQKELNKPNSTTKELNNNNNSMMTSQESMYVNRIPKLSPQQTETIQKLVFFQEEYESPAEEDVKKITPFTLGETEEDDLKRFKFMTEMTILTVQLIVEFSKKVPGFDTLLREDQITLLKACSSEVMMLRCSRKYDINTDSILYANNQPYTRENYKSASVDQSADQLFNFCRNMCMLKVDNAEYALISAIVIFSERPNLMEPKKVEKIQDYYVNILKTYVETKRQPNKCYFAKLLAILTELRTLGSINNEMCVSLKVKNKKLPPFLNELWDLS